MRRLLAAAMSAVLLSFAFVAPAEATERRTVQACGEVWTGSSLADACLLTIGYEVFPGKKGVRRTTVRLDDFRPSMNVVYLTARHGTHTEVHANLRAGELVDSTAGKRRTNRDVYLTVEVNPPGSSVQIITMYARLK